MNNNEEKKNFGTLEEEAAEAKAKSESTLFAPPSPATKNLTKRQKQNTMKKQRRTIIILAIIVAAAIAAYFLVVLPLVNYVEEITAEQYKEAVFQNSLIVKYSGEIPLFMLSEWSGGHISDRFSVRIMGFSKSEWDIYAYFKDEASEKYYRSKTAAGVQFLADIAEKYRTQNAVFAEKYISDFDGNEAEVLCTESPVVNILQIKEGSYAFDGGKEEDILRILGINPYLAKSYQESSDVRIYVEGDGVLRADTQGRLTYSASESGIETGAVDGKEAALAAVDKLYELASVLYGENTDMRFDIDEVKTDGSDADVQCVLKYGGISLEGDRFGAGVSVSDGKIIKLWIDNPYLEKSEYLTVLSTADAAALKPDKSSFETVYIWQNGLFMPITGAEEN